MTEICVYRKGQTIVKYTLRGHTGYAEQGEDIVCAAVSAVSMATLNGLTDVIAIPVGYEMAEGYLECILPDSLSEEERHDADVLLHTMVLSLKNLEEQYGEYITIMELEV
ncbi:MAG: ribosomal-processing cysteine protease Prp [Clostridia bacterium]|nr:ribosomal-processing cysteine protease Prp [Clostridia bacterium]